MGGCCCCCCFSSEEPEQNSAPEYYIYPGASEENAPTMSTGLLVDTNLDTSFPDAYRPPPAPIPFDVALGHPTTTQGAQGSCIGKIEAVRTMNSGSTQEITDVNAQETLAKSEDQETSNCKEKADKEPESKKEVEVKTIKLEEEDACPICLEDYDEENPKLTTKCEHHFHLACILEWMERSETCPVCDKEMVFDPPMD